MKSVIFIDVQGFQFGKDNFLCKEIALLNGENGLWMHKFIKMPLNLSHYNNNVQKHMLWLTKNIHGLQWNNNIENNNCINYGEISEFLHNNIHCDTPIAVKGSAKRKWLAQFINNKIINLEEFNCIPFEGLKNIFKSYHCRQHVYNNSLYCALENVYLLYFWHKYCNKT